MRASPSQPHRAHARSQSARASGRASQLRAPFECERVTILSRERLTTADRLELVQLDDGYYFARPI